MSRWKVVRRSDKRRFFCHFIFLPFSWLRSKAGPRGSAFLAVLVCFACPAWAGSRAGDLLSAKADVIVTFNLREILQDFGDVPSVQRYLDQWRLAARGD